jgi:hypothetical protein
VLEAAALPPRTTDPPNGDPSAEKSIRPVAAGLTVPANVTVCPRFDGFGDADIVVDERATISVESLELAERLPLDAAVRKTTVCGYRAPETATVSTILGENALLAVKPLTVHVSVAKTQFHG